MVDILVGILIVAVLGTAAYFAYKWIKSKETTPAPKPEVPGYSGEDTNVTGPETGDGGKTDPTDTEPAQPEGQTPPPGAKKKTTTKKKATKKEA